MEYLTNIPSIVLLTLSIIALPSNKAKKALAVGCDTYYRITGQIAGCTEASTENARELWLERYSTCLEIQLSQEISILRLTQCSKFCPPSPPTLGGTESKVPQTWGI